MHHNIAVFTFRTFPDLDDVKKIFPGIVILGKMKHDIELFLDFVRSTQPVAILGFAQSTVDESHFEPVAINNFNGKRIRKIGQEFVSLHVPHDLVPTFTIAKKPTNSFCNYAAYYLQNRLQEEGMLIPFSFVHVQAEDLEKLVALFRNDDSVV